MYHKVSTYLTVPATILTLFACIWIFLRYLRQKQKSIGFSMIMILSISDTILSVLLLHSEITHGYLGFTPYYIILYLTMYFSIFWASAISILVYKSLQERNFDSKGRLAKVIMIVLFPSIAFGLM